MRNTLKVAKWEIRRNITNKAFLISILITPLMMLLFGLIPSLLAKIETDKPFTIHIIDELGVYDNINSSSAPAGSVEFVKAMELRPELEDRVRGNKNEGFVVIDETTLKSGIIDIYTDTETKVSLAPVSGVLQSALFNYKLKSLGLNHDQINYLNQPYSVTYTKLETKDPARTDPQIIIPAVFAGILFLTVFTSGTMTFQSALQEKQDKMVELILSSIKAEDLMQGKILGYFVLGLLQVSVWLLLGIPAAQLIFKIPVLRYLLVPEIIPMIFFALAGYLLYSSIFVAIGATMEDAQSGSGFQGMIFLLPMLPVLLIAPMISNPSGTIALVGTFFPLTAPGVMLTRLSISPHIPLWEILTSAAVLLVTIMLIMRLAGKLFKTAILMYGKNATMGEIFKWMRY